MHKIDLLKGQGLPEKTTLGNVFLVTLMVVVPLLTGAGLVGLYAVNKIDIDVVANKLEHSGERAAELKANAKEKETLTKEISLYSKKLGEVNKCVDTYVQWTPVLITIAKQIDPNMVLDKLEAKNDEKSTSRRNYDPNSIPVPQRTLTGEFSCIDPNNLNKLMTAYNEKLDKELKSLPNHPVLRFFQNPERPDTSYTMNFIFNEQKK